MSVNNSVVNKLVCSLQLLKVSFNLLREEVISSLLQANQEIARTHVLIQQRMRNYIIEKQHKILHQSMNFTNVALSQKQNNYHACNGWQNANIKEINYFKLLQQNAQYKTELIELGKQIKTIKEYISNMAQNKNIKEQLLHEKTNLFNQQDRLANFVSRIIETQTEVNSELMTIKQVTQIQELNDSSRQILLLDSKKGDQQSHNSIQLHPFEYHHDKQFQNHSFEIESSSQLQRKQQREGRETFEESLQILKQFCNDSQHPSNFQLQGVAFLKAPRLQLKVAPKKTYLIFQEELIYIGNTNNLQPDGFGELYKADVLVYSGDWKRGTFEGWGKLFLPRDCGIQVYNGKWLKGLPDGPAEVSYWNDDKFIGTFQFGSVCGFGTYFHGGQLAHEGQWLNNKLVK